MRLARVISHAGGGQPAPGWEPAGISQRDIVQDGFLRNVMKADIFKAQRAAHRLWAKDRLFGLGNIGRFVQDFSNAFKTRQ